MRQKDGKPSWQVGRGGRGAGGGRGRQTDRQTDSTQIDVPPKTTSALEEDNFTTKRKKKRTSATEILRILFSRRPCSPITALYPPKELVAGTWLSQKVPNGPEHVPTATAATWVFHGFVGLAGGATSWSKTNFSSSHLRTVLAFESALPLLGFLCRYLTPHETLFLGCFLYAKKLGQPQELVKRLLKIFS